MQLKIRPATASDLPFIYSAWLKSFRRHPWVSPAPNAVYYKYHHDIIDRLLQRGLISVACSDEDEDQILGFVVYENRANLVILHYYYVKQPYRRMGIAGQLLRSLPSIDFYTHQTGPKHPILEEVEAVYNPYFMF